jgi:predicted GNAT superfamily acetyltransferase
MSPTPRSQADALCRRVQETDYAALLALQEANLRDNLAPDQRTEGFLSARFSRDQFATMDADVAVVVAEIDGSIVGYLCGSGVEFNRRFALLAAMIERYPHTQMHRRSLDSYESFVYGPVCVDRRFRGRGVLRGLYRALRAEVTDKFDIGVAFVAQDNAHSLSAHVQGLGMVDVGRFEFDARAYRILAFDVEEKV